MTRRPPNTASAVPNASPAPLPDSLATWDHAPPSTRRKTCTAPPDADGAPTNTSAPSTATATPIWTFATPNTLGDLKFIPCPADLDGDLDVGPADLLLLVGAWGTDPGWPPDLDHDGRVDRTDLVALLTKWGLCW